MIANWSMLSASIEQITRDDTQFSEMVLDSRERPVRRIRQKRVTLFIILMMIREQKTDSEAVGLLSFPVVEF